MKQLPEKWVVNTTNHQKELVSWLNKNNQLGINSYSSLLKYLHFPACGESHHYSSIAKGYTEITFEQFKEYVLKKKEIIGYKTPYRINLAICENTIYVQDGDNYCPENKKGEGSEWYLPYQIVSQWIPIYKEEKQLPKINGYEGKVTTPGEKLSYSTTVEYGCAVLNVQELSKFYAITKEFKPHGAGNRKVVSIKLDTGVEITMDQIKQIVEYFTTN